MRPRLAPSLVVALLAGTALPGCKNGPMAGGKGGSDGRRASASKGDDGGRSGVLPRSSELSERAFRVDTLVAQWDAAQSDGRDEEAVTLAAKIATEVDADFPAFRAAARGERDLRSQSLAVKALAFSRNPEALDVLVARLDEADPDLVANALIGIKLRADASTPLPPLVGLLRSKAPGVRRFAPLALANVLLAREAARMPLEPQISQRAMGGLVGLLEDHDPVVRLHVAKAMGALRAAEANDFLVMMLRDEHVRIRIAAAASLERIGDPRTFPKIVELLEAVDDDHKPLVREILVSYAERIQGAPLSQEQRTAFDVSPRAWDRWFASRTTPEPRRSGVLTPGFVTDAPPAATPPPPPPAKNSPPLPPPSGPRIPPSR